VIELLNATGLAPYVPWILLAGIVVKAITMALPPPTTSGWYNWLYTFLNALVLNLGKAKNASATEVPGPAKLVANGPMQSVAAAEGGSVSVGNGKG